jgi:hypothetical protein
MTIEWDTTGFKLPIWTVYERPKDFPNNYVVRLFDLEGPTKQHIVVETLAQAREAVPAGLACFAQCDPLEPQIVEAWL